MDIFNLFSLMGGLALFLFGMDIMGSSLEKLAGSKLRVVLEKLTSNPLKGFFLGLSVTAVIQSSSATTVMVVGFVNSGIMTLRQAIGIIMGSNVGTTVTAWILSLTGIQGESFWVKLFNPTSFSPILALIGIVLYMTFKRDKQKNIGTILLGFAILMTGMEAMSAAVKPLSNVPAFTSMFVSFSNPLLGVAVGAILTGVIQSSSASVGILQALSTTGAVTYGSALPIILGQNIGTCVTALLASIGANKNAKRAAMVHLYFNIIGAIVFMVIFYSLNAVLKFSFIGDSANAAGIAIIHTSFNLVATAFMLPFTKLLEKLAYITIKDDEKQEEFQLLDERLLSTPYLAVEQSKKLLNKMAVQAQGSLISALRLLDNWDDAVSKEIIESEITVDRYEDDLGTYLVRLSGQDLVLSDSHEISKMLHVVGDVERLSDHSINLLKVAEEMHDKSISFSANAAKELSVLVAAVEDILNTTITAFINNDEDMALNTEPLEQVIDELSREIKGLHIERLKSNDCTIELGFILSDLLTSCERVADHCSNISIAVIEAKNNSFAPHEYLHNFRNGDNSKFQAMFEVQKERYKI